MATIADIRLPGDPAPASLRERKETKMTTVKILEDTIDQPTSPGDRGRRRSVFEVETTTISESFAIMPKPSLVVPPVSNRRRISVAQWRDINTSLFNKKIVFDDVVAEEAIIASYKAAKKVKCIEDTFWSDKRALIPRYTVMEDLDDYAINGPSIPQTDMKELVDTLTEEADTELEKFRLIFRWIAYNVSYDSVFLNTGERMDQSPATVLQTGVAVCEGFSQLLCDMTELAGLKCETITGVSKSIGFHPGAKNYLKEHGKHAWNKVFLKGKWFLCDATWAAGVSNRGSDGMYTFERKWGEGFFLGDPLQFEETHFPLENEDDPIPDAWIDSIQVGRAAIFYHMECLSHEEGVIKAENNKALIKMKSLFPVDVFCRLTKGAQEIPNQGVDWWDGDVLSCSITLPEPGEYVFTVYGTFQQGDMNPVELALSQKIAAFYGTSLVTFTIVAKGSEAVTSPKASENITVWGVDPWFARQGFTPISHIEPFIDAPEGSTTISFNQGDDPQPLIFHFAHMDSPDVSLEEHVYIETVALRLVCHIFCPRPGKYIFSLKIKKPDDLYYQAVAYMITSSRVFKGGEDAPVKFPTGHNGPWGPNEAFFKMQMTVRGPDSSTILANEGESYFVIRSHKSRDLELNMTLKSAESGKELRNGHAFIQTAKGKNTATSSISLRLSEAGMYQLKVFAKVDPEAERTFVGCWLVVCTKPCWKSLFPKGSVSCGTTEEFYAHGLETSSEALIETDDGECQLEVTITKDLFLNFSLKLGEGEKDIHQGKMFSEIVKRDGQRVAVFIFRLHEVGLYAFRLFVKKTHNQDKATYVGMWLIDCHGISSKEPYPPRSGMWGPNKVFQSAGMKVVDIDSSQIDMSKGQGKLCIKHSAKISAKKMSFRLDKNGNKYDSTRIISAETCWPKNGADISTTLQFLFDEPGMYALLIFDGSKQSSSFAGQWLLNVQAPTDLPLFPEYSGMWGPSENFFKMEMTVDNTDCSTVTTDSGECQLDISASSAFNASFHLFEDNKSKRLPKEHVSVTYTKNDRNTVQCKVKLPHEGLFGLQFFAAEKGNKSLKSCGIWLVIWWPK
ncbi:uncharacterized protein [Diadema antillarum]|uniref:uncharacterized protein n=1 Tax=Diadema antillarum TaxID=105358 RepID=UPI003A877F3A